MAIFPIRLFGDPVLRQKAAEVPQVDRSVRKLMKDMSDTMRDAPGLGLAANQVGVLRRVIVWANEDERGALVNPAILDKGGQDEDEEGCLSLPGLKFPVVRSQWVRVQGLNEKGDSVVIEAEDLTARIFQHEIDHIDGILFLDHLSPDLQREARRRLREEALK
ncbi:MAG: peptide deformylase [Actinomycetota bacterium]